jgi:hypothetical protein
LTEFLPPIGTIEYQGRHITVTCRIAFDGVEYIGRLWFEPEGDPSAALPDRSAIAGRTRDEVLTFAQRFSAHELLSRLRRALAE